MYRILEIISINGSAEGMNNENSAGAQMVNPNNACDAENPLDHICALFLLVNI